MPTVVRSFTAALAIMILAAAAAAQSARSPDEAAAIAAADSLLAALSRDDKAGLARFTTDSAILGYAAIRGGVERVRVHSVAEVRAQPSPVRITERGFGATAR